MVFGSKKKSAKKKDEKKKDEKKEPAAKDEKGESNDEVEIGEPSVEFVPSSEPAVQSSAAPSAPAPQAGGGAKTASTTVAGPPPEEIYVDGVSSLYFRSGVVKLDCYRVVRHDPQENKEIRMGTHRLVMPGTALQELIQLLQNASQVQQSRKAGKTETKESD